MKVDWLGQMHDSAVSGKLGLGYPRTLYNVLATFFPYRSKTILNVKVNFKTDPQV